ncbi:flexible cuticle protein 12 [Anabrus simplex]|uniref:flexible cuticle protein 12 n=1 Tax=Anabrus simplex TaxID=316456 RepID=UPI0034DD80F1
MNLVHLMVVLVTLSWGHAAPQRKDGDAVIVSEHREGPSPDGSKWSWGFAADNGISREESGSVGEEGRSGEESISVKGRYTYTVDGTTYAVTYTGGRHGYQMIMKPIAGGRRQKHRVWDFNIAP